jgi:hypothetical protein
MTEVAQRAARIAGLTILGGGDSAVCTDGACLVPSVPGDSADPAPPAAQERPVGG